MADYSQLKVPDLKKILQERGLAVSGNKADLIARIGEDDGKKSGGSAAAPAANEDEIDWDEDQDDSATAAASKASTAPAAAALAAGGIGRVANPVAVPNQQVDVDPSTTSDLTVKEPAPATAGEAGKPDGEGDLVMEEKPKQSFAAGLEKSDEQTELEKRAKRAERFNTGKNKKADAVPEAEEDPEKAKLAARAEKFKTAKKEDGGEEEVGKKIVSVLDSALPERRERKRGRENGGGDRLGVKDEGRERKRQTPDRRVEGGQTQGGRRGGAEGGRDGRGAARGGAAGAGAGGAKKVTDDPAEKAKAEARAKRFAKPA